MVRESEEWIYLPWMETGNGSDISLSPDITQASRNFFKLLYSDSPGSDFDNDGLSNSDEVKIHGLDPFNPDSDYDGLPDGWEVSNGLNPLLDTDAALDSFPYDGDTLTNLKEYQLGTNPKKKDSDDDGLDDNVEFNAGGDPVHFDMPEFTLVSATREAVLRETIERQIGQPVSHAAHSTATGRGTSAGIYSSRTFNLSNPSTSTTFSPWSMNSAAGSAWATGTGIPEPLLPIESHDMSTPLFASRKEKMHGDDEFIAVPGQSNVEEYRNITRDGAIVERTVRVKASRTMPVAWSIPYTRSKVSKSTRDGGFSAPSVTSGFFTFTAGQMWSTAVTMDLGSTGAIGGTVAAKPGRKRANANAPWTNNLFTAAEAVEWLNIEKIDPASTNINIDSDRDGVPNALEISMGTAVTTRNTDGLGYADGDQLNLKLLPPAETFLISTRRTVYEFNPEDPECPYHPAHRLATETDNPYKSDVDDDLTIPTGLGDPFHARLAAGAPFPANAPTYSSMPLLSDDGTSAVIPAPSSTMGYTYNPDSGNPANTIEAADGNQQRAWISFAEVPASAMHVTGLKLRRVNASGSGAQLTITPHVFHFTTTSRVSTNYIELLSKNVTTGAASSVITEAATRPLFLVPEFNSTGVETGKKVPVSSLKIPKMENSINSSGELNPDLDRERFYIGVDAPLATTMTLVMRTVDAAGSTDDDPSTITLTKGAGGRFLSPSMMLVPDDTDDKFPAGDTEPANNERTHYARLGGSVQIDSITIDGTTTTFQDPAIPPPVCPIPIVRKIKCHFVAYPDTKGSGAAGYTQQNLNSLIGGANRFLAQSGVVIEAVGTLNQQPYPQGVANSEVLFSDTLYGSQLFSLSPNASKFASAASPLRASSGEFVIILCRDITLTIGAGQIFGFATVPRFSANQAEHNFVFCGTLKAGSSWVLAHEIGHLLSNNGHFGKEYGQDAPAPVIPQNLMRDGGPPSMTPLVRAVRLREDQVNRILKHSELK